MHKVLVNCFGGLSLPKKSVVRLTDCPDMTLDLYPGCKTTQHNNNNKENTVWYVGEFSNSVDPDELVHYELHHLDLHKSRLVYEFSI